MKKVIAYIKPYLLDKIIDALRKNGIKEIFLEEIKKYIINNSLNSFLPRFKIQLFIEDESVEIIKEIIFEQSSRLEDNEEDFEVSDIIESIDIHTGERNVLVNHL